MLGRDPTRPAVRQPAGVVVPALERKRARDGGDDASPRPELEPALWEACSDGCEMPGARVGRRRVMAADRLWGS